MNINQPVLAKVLITLLILYAIIGLASSLTFDWQMPSVGLFSYLAFYIGLPLFAALAITRKHKVSLFVCSLGFFFIGLRVVGLTDLLPFHAPISISITFGDFSNGTGGLVDLFAILLGVLFILISRQIKSEKINDSKPA